MEKPSFKYERRFWRRGYKFVVGIDEVGRGAFAGPIVVSAVVWPRPLKLKIKNEKLKIVEEYGLDDSKRLKPKEREKLVKFIKKNALAWDITEVGVSVINKIGIGKATEKAMRKAVGDIVKLLDCYIATLTKKNSRQFNNLTIQQYNNFFVLTDFYNIPYLRGIGLKNQKGIKKGDQKSISIAAASILAKVHRDKLMLSLGKKYKHYGWGRNKGYGTKEHQKAILQYGLTRYHRKKFVKTWMEKRAETG